MVGFLISALPMPHEKLSVIREANWVGLVWSTASDLDKRAAYLCNALSFDMALRVSSFTRMEPRHIIALSYIIGVLCYCR